MTLDQLRYFTEAARFEHIGKAARSLHISAGAVSTAILALEREMKRPLFRRESKRIFLNQEGKYLLARSDEIFAQINSMRSYLHGDTVAFEGHYRIGGSHFLSSRLLAKAWTRILSSQPKVSGEICSMSTTQLMNDLVKGTLDVGLAFSPLIHPDLSQYKIYEGQLLLAVSRKHPILAKKRNFTLADLSKYPATLHKSAPGIDLCETHPNFAKYKIIPQISCLFDSDDSAVENLKYSEAWSLLPDIVIHSCKDIAAVPHPENWNAPYHIALVQRRRLQEPFIFSLLKNEIQQIIAHNPK
jgi:DNA-binding transcriptional LysR family regulator